jgi:thiol-disulfide isomerase/thioredoxin
MHKRLNLLIVTIALASAGMGLLASLWMQGASRDRANDGAVHLKVGDVRDDVQLPDVSGKPHKLSEWDGHLVVLNFWASWCGPCREEMPLLERSQQRYAERGVQIVGVAADTGSATRAFLGRYPVHYPILVDDPAAGRDVSLTYGNTRGVLPYTVLLGRDGLILAQRFGNFTEKGLEQWLVPHLQ